MLMVKEVKIIKNEQGFASVVVALTLIIVMALLTVAFAQLARREQQNALDKQLAIQAYYAAESGVNDIVANLDKFDINTYNGGSNSNNCIDKGVLNAKIGAVPPYDAQSVSNQNGVSYSCILLNKTPTNVTIDDVSNEQGQYATLTAASSTINGVNIEWSSGDGRGAFVANATSTKFPPQSVWRTGNYPAVVQFTLTPASNANLNRSAFINNSFTAYLYPANIGQSGAYADSPVSFTPANSGQIVSGKCSSSNTPYNCKVTITGLNDTKYIFHAVTYYDDKTNIRVTPLDSSNNPLPVLDQATIDVTGKAQNVVKRIRVVVRTNPSNGTAQPVPILPDYALEGQNICKRIWAAPVTADNPTGSQYKYPGSAPSPDPCNLSN